MKKILISGLIAGIILFIISYGGLFLAVQFFPSLFVDYNNPLFNSSGDRDVLFYMHAFIISLALSWIWARFKGVLSGPTILRAIYFGIIYASVALLPVMWITFSAMDITISMVLSWFFYGFVQAFVAGIVFAYINP